MSILTILSNMNIMGWKGNQSESYWIEKQTESFGIYPRGGIAQ